MAMVSEKNDDTTQWGTKTDSWTEMGLEEALDLTIYLSAQLLRLLDNEEAIRKRDEIRVNFALKQAAKIRNLEAQLEKYEEAFGTDLSDNLPLL